MKKLVLSLILVLVGSCLLTSCCCTSQKVTPTPQDTTVPRDNK